MTISLDTSFQPSETHKFVPQDQLKLSQTNDKLNSSSIESSPLVHFVNNTLCSAVVQRASDIHFEPYMNTYRIRFRIDGVLQENFVTISQALACAVAIRLKIISELNIAETRLPQDGSLTFNLPDGNKIPMRIATSPTRWGEKVVLRLLPNSEKLLNIHQLGMGQVIQQHYQQSLEQPQGLILITGPTGSGKSITLYSGLQYLNHVNKNICSVEDPVEIPMIGINQLQINEKIGLTFARALRAFLRQDPDIIMVGEIRDQETAEISIKAAHTGHLVLSTLHTNSAIGALTRLVQMGIPTYLLTSSVKLIIAQRLLRRLCAHCCSTNLTNFSMQKQYSLATKLTSYYAKGCSHCNDGYSGRIGVYEALPITTEISNALLQNADEQTVYQLAIKQGMKNMQDVAVQLILNGKTTLEELHRVFGIT